MPNWKKVIVSGSDAVLNSITSSAGISSSGFVYAPLFFGDLFGNAQTATSATSSILATSASTLLTINTNSDTVGEYRITFVPSGTEANYNTLNVDDDDLRYIPNPGRLYVPNVFSSGDIHAEGNVIANQYIVSSSVYYTTQSFSSGSTIFGNDQVDTHQFTGSLYVTGSRIILNSGPVGTGDSQTGPVNARLGVNVTNPEYGLHVRSNNGIFLAGNIGGSTENVSWYKQNGGLFQFRSNGPIYNLIESVTSSGGAHSYTQYKTGNGSWLSGQQKNAKAYKIVNGTDITSDPHVFITGSTSNGTARIGILNSNPTHELSVTGDISASGALFASLSLDNSNFNTVMYDTTTGKFYYTGSYGGGGGGGTSLTGLDTEIVFFNGDDNPDSVASFTFDPDTTFFNVGNLTVNAAPNIWADLSGEWDGNLMHAKGYPTVVNASYGGPKRIDFVGLGQSARWEQLYPGTGRGGLHPLGGAPSPYFPGYNNITGSEVTINGPLYVANIYAEVEGEDGYVTLYINASGSGGGPIQGPGGGVVIDGSVGGMVLSPDKGILLFDNNQMEKDASGSLLTPIESASAQIKLTDDKTSLSVKVGKTNLKDVMFISASGDNPRIGIGTTNPKATFDIEEVEDSTIGTRLLLKSARTTTGAQVGDSAGSINFAIDSASFNDIFTSGSVAAIDSRVRSIDDTGDGVPNVAGNIIFKSSPEWIETLNEVAEIGYFHFDNLNPSEDSEPGMIVNGQLTVGSGSLWQSQPGDVAFSVYNRDSISDNNNYLKLRVTGSNVDIPSGSLSVSKSISTEGEITTNTISTISTVIGSDSATIVDSFQGLDYQGAIYDYLLFDDGVGVRSGQFFLAQNPGTAQITFTDTSTPHLIDSVAPEISASYNTSYVEVKVINGNGYTFKAFVKKL